MSLMFCSLSSGSSGNSCVVCSDETALIVDAGISGKRIMNGIDDMGLEPEDISALLLTHEHTDHIKSVGVLNRNLPGMVTYASRGTWEHVYDSVDPERQRRFDCGESFDVGDIRVDTFRLSHDAEEPAGFSFSNADGQISMLTDTGCVTEEAFAGIRDADILVIEANHDSNVLKVCRRPWQVIRRIAGSTGHLSNDDAAACIRACCEYDDKPRVILLAHLSAENNMPDLARQVVRNTLREDMLANLRIDVIERDKPSSIYMVGQ